MSARNWLVMIGLAGFLLGCGEATVPVDATISKSEARQLALEGDFETEWCARMSWYGDAVCDDFCRVPDPDCMADDELEPWLTVDGGLDGTIIEDGVLRISGHASDESGIQEVLVNGVPAELEVTSLPETDFAWSYDFELPKKGEYRVIVQATDGAGNPSRPTKLVVGRDFGAPEGAWH